MQIYVKVPEDVDNSWVKGEPKPSKQQIVEDNNFILAGFRPVSLPGALAVTIMRFF
jgi:hypothetical protein